MVGRENEAAQPLFIWRATIGNVAAVGNGWVGDQRKGAQVVCWTAVQIVEADRLSCNAMRGGQNETQHLSSKDRQTISSATNSSLPPNKVNNPTRESDRKSAGVVGRDPRPQSIALRGWTDPILDRHQRKEKGRVIQKGDHLSLSTPERGKSQKMHSVCHDSPYIAGKEGGRSTRTAQ